MKTLMNITTVLILLLATTGLQAADINKKIMGTWKYTANEAPDGYRNGEILFFEKDGVTRAKIVTDYDTIVSEKIKTEKDKVTFNFYAEYELCTAKLTYTNNVLKGDVDTVEGKIALTLKRKVKK